jgi:hypothetical protein
VAQGAVLTALEGDLGMGKEREKGRATLRRKDRGLLSSSVGLIKQTFDGHQSRQGEETCPSARRRGREWLR